MLFEKAAQYGAGSPCVQVIQSIKIRLHVDQIGLGFIYESGGLVKMITIRLRILYVTVFVEFLFS